VEEIVLVLVVVLVLESVGRAVGVMEFWSIGRKDRRTAQSFGANSANNLSKRDVVGQDRVVAQVRQIGELGRDRS